MQETFLTLLFAVGSIFLVLIIAAICIAIIVFGLLLRTAWNKAKKEMENDK